METMSYNKINKKRKKSYGVYGFFTFIILGTGIVIYSIINEPTPIILGEDPLMDVNIYDEQVISTNVNVEYKVENKSISEKFDNFKTNIVIPVISIGVENLTDINDKISKEYIDRANALKEQMSGNVENKFTYKVTYNVYENEIDGERILSITVHDRIVDDAAGTTTTDRVSGYNIKISGGKLISQEDLALDALGSNHASLIKEQIKSTVVGSNMLSGDKYNYTLTGLEQCYVKDNKFHIILNEGEVVDKSYGVVDIEITK